jgi:hypothetical protein
MLNERGVELHCLTENINTTTPGGKLTFHIFAALAEFERSNPTFCASGSTPVSRRQSCGATSPAGRTSANGELKFSKVRFRN